MSGIATRRTPGGAGTRGLFGEHAKEGYDELAAPVPLRRSGPASCDTFAPSGRGGQDVPPQRGRHRSGYLAPELAVPLRAGPLRLVFDRGAVRWVRLGEREVLRGIYFALRGENWVTLPPTLENLEIEAEVDSFRIRFRARHERGPVRFSWDGRITGAPDGRIQFGAQGTAGSTFLRNRIGLCVLHPAEACAGRALHRPARGRRPRRECLPGVRRAATSPSATCARSCTRSPPGSRPRSAWRARPSKPRTRATGATPRSRPTGRRCICRSRSRSRRARASSSRWRVDLRDHGRAGRAGRGHRARRASEEAQQHRARGGGDRRRRGARASGDRPCGGRAPDLDPADAERLRPLRLAHVRADLHLELDGWDEDLGRAAANAGALARAARARASSCPSDPGAPLRRLAARLAQLRPTRRELPGLRRGRPDQPATAARGRARSARGGIARRAVRGRRGHELRGPQPRPAGARHARPARDRLQPAGARVRRRDDRREPRGPEADRRDAPQLRRRRAARDHSGHAQAAPGSDALVLALRRGASVHRRPAPVRHLCRGLDARTAGGGGRGGFLEPDALRARRPRAA